MENSKREATRGLQLSHWLIFQITAIGLLMAVGGMGANLNGALSNDIINENTSLDETKVVETLTVEQYVRNYFSDIPVLVEVARCESQFRQHGRDGRVLVGLQNRSDKGVMQINRFYHIEKADKLGLDIETLEGNTAYARYLFEKEGLQPWISSSKCWKATKAYGEYRTELALNSK